MVTITSGWVRQPTTLIGLFSGGAVLFLAALGKMDAATAGVAVTACLGLAGIDDNTAAGRDVRELAADAAAVATAAHMSDRLPKLIQDAVKTARGVSGTERAAGPDRGRAAGALALLLALALPLAACGGLGAADWTEQATAACRVDRALQPIAAETLAALVPKAERALTADQLAVHPAVIAWCGSLGGTPLAPLPAAPEAAKS